MHAVGNQICSHNPKAKIIYVHSERFVADMVKALQLNAISDFQACVPERRCIINR